MREALVLDDVLRHWLFDYLQDMLSGGTKWPRNYERTFTLFTAATELTPLARRVFKNDRLVPSTPTYVDYQGSQVASANDAYHHGSSFTINLCVYQRTAWPIWVDGREYTLRDNQGLAYRNDQKRWREAIPDASDNRVITVCFHFVEYDHWWFKKGPLFRKEGIEPLERAAEAAHHADHKRILWMLTRAHNTRDFYARVCEAFPDADPLDKVFACVEAECAEEGGALELTLSKSMLTVARCLAEAHTVDDILTKLNASARVPATRAAVERAVAALHSSPLAMLFP